MKGYIRDKLVFITLLCFPSVALAEFSCVSEVTYKWLYTKEEVASPVGRSDKSEKGAKPEIETKELEVPWSTLVEFAPEQVEAKIKLEEKLRVEKRRAYEECVRAHENFSGCFSAKFQAQSQGVQTLSWRARQILEDAIKSDCTKTQGKCLGANSSEITCTEKVVATPTPAETTTKADAKGKAKK